jgi:hypothetical protein
MTYRINFTVIIMMILSSQPHHCQAIGLTTGRTSSGHHGRGSQAIAGLIFESAFEIWQ